MFILSLRFYFLSFVGGAHLRNGRKSGTLRYFLVYINIILMRAYFYLFILIFLLTL